MLFRTDWGSLVNLAVVIGRIWAGLFGVRAVRSACPVWAAWASLMPGLSPLCVCLLRRKVRAYEVVS